MLTKCSHKLLVLLNNKKFLCVFQNIVDGIEKLCDINSKNDDVRFPATYYGLGKANATLNK